MSVSRYKFAQIGNQYVIIDKFPFETVIETFYEDEYDIARETFEIYIDEEKRNKSSQLDRKERIWKMVLL